MRPNDRPRPRANGSLTPPEARDGVPANGDAAEPGSGGPVTGDVADESACNWEAAWVDLGGEG
jgi:hypothetical protein